MEMYTNFSDLTKRLNKLSFSSIKGNNMIIKKLLIILLSSTLFMGCVSNSFDKNEYIGNDYKPVEYFINLRLISFGDNYRIYTDTLTGVLYYSVKQNGKWSSPIVIIEEDNTALTYNEAMIR